MAFVENPPMINDDFQAIVKSYTQSYTLHSNLTTLSLTSSLSGLRTDSPLPNSANRNVGHWIETSYEARWKPSGLFKDVVMQTERELLERALMHADGNKSVAARLRGMKFSTFRDKLVRHGWPQD